MPLPPPLEVLVHAATSGAGRTCSPGTRSIAAGPLTAWYGDRLELPERRPAAVIANLVSTIDGVTTFDRADLRGASAVAAGSEADRLVMAMLRAAADVVVVGAATLRVTRGHRWTAEALLPELRSELAEVRRRMGAPGAAPRLAVVTASGALPGDHPALAEGSGALIVTTPPGAERAGRDGLRLPTVVPDGATSGPLPGAAILDAIDRELAPRLVLTEGGPLLLGALLAAGRVDQLFLTVTPLIAGRAAGDARAGLVEGFAPGPSDAQRARALSVRRASDGAMLFRYALRDVS